MSKPFQTTVVGSMPKPAWLMEQLPLNAKGKQVHGKGADWHFSGDVLGAALDDATRLTVHDQVHAGIDILSDGVRVAGIAASAPTAGLKQVQRPKVVQIQRDTKAKQAEAKKAADADVRKMKEAHATTQAVAFAMNAGDLAAANQRARADASAKIIFDLDFYQNRSFMFGAVGSDMSHFYPLSTPPQAIPPQSMNLQNGNCQYLDYTWWRPAPYHIPI